MTQENVTRQTAQTQQRQTQQATPSTQQRTKQQPSTEEKQRTKEAQTKEEKHKRKQLKKKLQQKKLALKNKQLKKVTVIIAVIVILVSQIRISLIVTRQAIKLERNNHRKHNNHNRPNNDQQLSRLRDNQPQDKLHNEVLRLVKVSQAKNHQIVMNNIVSSYQSEILKQSCFKSHFYFKTSN